MAQQMEMKSCVWEKPGMQIIRELLTTVSGFDALARSNGATTSSGRNMGFTLWDAVILMILNDGSY